MLQTVLREHMDNANPRNRHLLLKRAMPVVEDSDNDSSISNEDCANLSEVANGSSDDQVKLELRNAIRSRRVAKGLEEVPNVDPKRPRIEQLTPEEEEKRRLRRERNKLAAFKCRQRRKEHIQHLEQESDGLEEENETLENEIAALKAQKEQLEEMFKKHICRLDNKKDGNPTASPETCSAEAAKDEGALNPKSPSSMFQSKA